MTTQERHAFLDQVIERARLLADDLFEHRELDVYGYAARAEQVNQDLIRLKAHMP